jgi:primosomal protein N' (replication factor Y) (superfamily II helicase)
MYAAVFPLVAARALERPFDYIVPDEMGAAVCRGALVAVPLARRMVLGVVFDLRETSPHAGRHLPIGSVVDLPPVPAELLDVARHVSRYYLTSLGAALSLAAPPVSALRLDRWVELSESGRRALAERSAGSEDLRRFEIGALATGTARLDGLRRREWIDVTYRLKLTRQRGRVAIVVPGSLSEKGLGARQKAAVGVVRQRGPVPVDELQRESGLGSAGLRSLVARGVIGIGPDEARPEIRGSSTAHAGEVRPDLLPEQKEALAIILSRVGRGEEVLLHGVTGSGKTEVYLRAAEAVLAAGRGVLYLVPEIALTGQTVARVRARFPDEPLAVMHSGLSAGERLANYADVASGRARLVVGARSAVFAPLSDLGLIVIDEEHDTSYKQDSDPRYDARLVARWRARAGGAVVVSGSATPSVEAFARIAHHADLPRRVDGSPPPSLELIDMRDVSTLLSSQLARALTTAIEAGEKAILFLNRRGYAAYLACAHCGHSWICPHCDVPMALFVRGRRLRCRLCGHAEPAPARCPECHGVDLTRFGHGTEAVENEVARLLPGIDLLRLDSDVAASPARLREVLDRFASPAGAVLVGTQMIAKGHHFPQVTLVGVVNADTTLRFPDFRAEERTYSMLLQVGGRSGRGSRPGRVLVQTLEPQARPIAMAAAGEHERFYREELARRRELLYPPLATLIAVEISSQVAAEAADDAGRVARRLGRLLRNDERVLGPGPLSRERGRYLARLLVKSTDAAGTLGVLAGGLEACRADTRRSSRLVVDVDPQWL